MMAASKTSTAMSMTRLVIIQYGADAAAAHDSDCLLFNCTAAWSSSGTEAMAMPAPAVPPTDSDRPNNTHHHVKRYFEIGL